MRSKILATLVSASLAATATATTTAASAQSAQALSLANSPAAAQARESDLGGRRGWTPVIVGLAVVGILVFVLIGLGKNHPLPDSP